MKFNNSSKHKASSKKNPSLQQRRAKLWIEGSSFAPVKREDIVGIDNVLKVADDIIFWLKNYQEYEKAGARLEPGVLFEGAPGTGKTMVSRYIATASGAKFINLQDFSHPGQLLTDVDLKDLFDQARIQYARSKKPIILFWDEFEIYASDRYGNHNLDQTSLISQLSAELDGIKGRPQGVILIACANHADSIDAALLRPGRLGVQVEFVPPDRKGKEQLVEHYLDTITHKTIDIPTIALLMADTDAASAVEELIHAAWGLTVQEAIISKSKPCLTQQHLQEVAIQRLIGPVSAISGLSDDSKFRVALHEMGHALVAKKLGSNIRLISIHATKKGQLGQTQIYHNDEYFGIMEDSLKDVIVGCGGMAVEKYLGFSQSTSASGDIIGITSSLCRMIDEEGLKDPINPQTLHEIRDYSRPGPAILNRNDIAIVSQAKECLQAAEDIVATIRKQDIKKLAEELVERITLTGTEFEELVKTVIPEFELWDKKLPGVNEK